MHAYKILTVADNLSFTNNVTWKHKWFFFYFILSCRLVMYVCSVRMSIICMYFSCSNMCQYPTPVIHTSNKSKPRQQKYISRLQFFIFFLLPLFPIRRMQKKSGKRCSCKKSTQSWKAVKEQIFFSQISRDRYALY